MRILKNTLKSAYKIFFGGRADGTPELRSIHKKIGDAYVSERLCYYGRRPIFSKTLKAESAPGTIETILSLLEGLGGSKSVLDYGCGQNKSEYFRKLGLNIHSCDTIHFPIKNFTKINAAEKRLPFKDKQFDVVIASEVIEHIESPWDFLREIKRITKEKIFVSTPNTISQKSRSLFKKTGYLHWFEPKDFEYHRSPIFFWQIENFCKEEGIEIVAIRGNHSILGLPGNLFDKAESLILELRVMRATN